MKTVINKLEMKKRGIKLLVVFMLVLLFSNLVLANSEIITGEVTKRVVLSNKFGRTESIFAEDKTVQVFTPEGKLVATNPTDIEALKTISDKFTLKIAPTEAQSIKEVTIQGIDKDDLDKDILLLNDVPIMNSNFTTFEVLSSSVPLQDFEIATLDFGYICAGPRHEIYKCENWDPEEGICLNESDWNSIRIIPKGLAYVQINLTPVDPGIGMGPSPYGSVCGDLFCETDYGESCSTCVIDCGICIDQQRFSFWNKLGDWLTGAAIADTPINNETLACIEVWECSDWSPYTSDGFRHRDCWDKNKCGTTLHLPPTEERCEWMEPESEMPVEERKLKWGRVAILTTSIIIILLLTITLVKTAYIYSKNLISPKSKKRKTRKRRDKYEIMKAKLKTLSKEAEYTDNLELVLDRLSTVIKKILLSLIGSREKLTFLDLNQIIKSSKLTKSQKAKALSLSKDMEKVRFAGKRINRKSIHSFIKRARALIPRQVKKPVKKKT